MSEHL